MADDLVLMDKGRILQTGARCWEKSNCPGVQSLKPGEPWSDRADHARLT